MSTAKMVGIAAVVILLFMGIIGACLFSGETDNDPTPAKVTVSASERLAQAEDDYADLARQLQTLRQENSTLQQQNSQLASRISALENRVKVLERERE